jgi:hypothetical protein
MITNLTSFYFQAPICAHVSSTDALLSEIDNLGSQALRETNKWHLQVNNLEQMEDGAFRRDQEERKEWFCETGARCRMESYCGHVNFIVSLRNPSSSPVDTSSVSTEMETSTDLSTDSWD